MQEQLVNNPPLSVEYLSISELEFSPHNARKHPPVQIRRLAACIGEYGFLIPVVIGPGNEIVAGHGRVQAAKLRGIEKIPTIRIEHLSDAQVRAFRIADNRLTELAEWDMDRLGEEFRHLVTIPDLDLTLTGFDLPKIDLFIQGDSIVDAEEDPDVFREHPDAITDPGDLWVLGDHRILCGNALDDESYARLMDGHKAQMVFTDPPYNVPINRHVCGLGKVQHDEFAMAAGEMSPEEFTGFLDNAIRLVVKHAADGSIHFICMDWRHMQELLTAGAGFYGALKNLCVWNKDNGGMGALYRSQHELVFVYKYGTAPHVNNVELGKHGRYRTNVWNYPGQNSLHADRNSELAMHPTVKPVAMVADAILDCSRRGGLVLDPFGGSGTTLIAAEKTGRHARLIELEPRYVDVTIRRWQNLTGKKALHAQNGNTFDEMEAANV